MSIKAFPLTPDQDYEDRDAIRHALGLDQSPRAYRKHYVAPLDGPVRKRLDRLERMGLFVRYGEPDRVGQCFHVTAKGAALVGVKLP